MDNELTIYKTSSRRLVKVAGIEVTPSLQSLQDWRGIVAYFVGYQDVKESSRKLYAKTLSQFFLWVEKTGRDLSQMTRTDILEYVDSLKEEGLSPLTIGSYLVAVRKFYEFAESEKVYPNIAKGVKSPKKKNTFRKKYLHEDEIENLLSVYEEKSLRDFAIVNLLVRTGLRTIEVVRANVGDIDIVNGKRVLYVWGKGHDEKDDFVVLTDKTYLPIRRYLDSRKGVKPGEPLFSSESRQNYGERLTTMTISTIAKNALREIGLDSHSYTAHSLRHTTASMILEKGGTLLDVKKVLRHTSVETSEIYTRMKEEEDRIQTPPEALLDAI